MSKRRRTHLHGEAKAVACRKIRRMRVERGLSCNDVDRLCGFPLCTTMHYDRQRAAPSKERFELIVATLARIEPVPALAEGAGLERELVQLQRAATVKERREDCEASIAQLARRAGVCKVRLGKFERGLCALSDESYLRVARALDAMAAESLCARNSVLAWFAARVRPSETLIANETLYLDYCAWCEAEGLVPEARNQPWGTTLTQLGYSGRFRLGRAQGEKMARYLRLTDEGG